MLSAARCCSAFHKPCDVVLMCCQCLTVGRVEGVDAAVKVVRMDDRYGLGLLRDELNVYQTRLPHLQGTFTPKLLAYGTTDNGRVSMACSLLCRCKPVECQSPSSWKGFVRDAACGPVGLGLLCARGA